MKLKKIEDKLFCINKRIKTIDKRYFICFNKIFKRFEVHYSGQKDGSFCFDAGSKLNSSVLRKVYLTQSKNAKKLFKQIEENNKKIEEQKNKSLTERYMSDFDLMLDFASRKTGDINFSQNNFFKWI